MTSTRAFKKVRLQVIKEEPTCRLRLPGCTGISEEADHIIPKSERPDLYLVRSNLRGACGHCNRKRGVSDIHVDRPAALDFFDINR